MNTIPGVVRAHLRALLMTLLALGSLATGATSAQAQPVLLGNVIKSVTDLNGGSVLRGDTLEYIVSVTNSGTSASLFTRMTDTLPATLRYVPGSLAILSGPNAGAKTDATLDDQGDSLSARRVRFRLGTGANGTLAGTLSAGASTTMRFLAVVQNSVTSGTVIGNSAFVDYDNGVNDVIVRSRPTGGLVTGEPTVVTVLLPDLTISKSHTGNFVRTQQGTYTITVNNIGAGASADTITVVDNVPAGLTPSAASGAGWSCVIAGQTVTCKSTSVIGAGASGAPITVTATVLAGASSPVTNTVTVSGFSEANTANNSASDATTIVDPSPDLAISKNVSGPFTIGSPGTYQLVVSNLVTPSTTGPITVTDTLASGLSFSSGLGTNWACAAVGQVVTCSNAAGLSGGGSSTITLTVSVSAPAAPSVSNTAHVQTAGDANALNNSSTVSNPVNPAPVLDLAITKSHVGSFVVGQPGTFTLSVANIGNTATSGVITITDTLPVGLSYTSSTGAGWSCTAVGQIVTCSNPGPIGPGATSSLTLTTTVASSTLGGVVNRAHVSTAGDLNAVNDVSSDPVLVISIPDLALAKSATSPLVVGQNATYQLTVTNVSPGPTSGAITVTDNLPAGLTYVSAAGTGWSCSAIGSAVTCTNAGPLSAGASTNVNLTVLVGSAAQPTVTNAARVSTPGDANTANDVGTTTNLVGSGLDLALSKVAGPLVVGGQGTFTLTAQNVGTVPTTGPITISDNLPAGLTYISGTGPSTTCSASGLVIVTCVRTAVLNPGESFAITLTVAVAAAAAPSVVNTAILSTPGDGNLPNNIATTPPIPVGAAEPDLRLVKSLVGSAIAGQQASFSLTVTNVGGAATTGAATIVDQLIAGVTFVSAAGAGWQCNVVGQTVSCVHPASIAPGQSRTVTLTVLLAPNLTSLTNSATVATPGDNNPTNNSASIPVTPVGGAPDVALSKTANGPFIVGQTSSYSLVVTNVGTAATTGASTVTDVVPNGLTILSAQGTSWTCTIVGQTVTCVFAGSLAVGQSASVTLTVLVTSGALPSVTNSAVVTTPGDVTPTNDGASATTPVAGQLDLSLTKLNPGVIAIGGNVSYTLVVRNVGSLDAAPIRVTDVIPPGLVFLNGGGDGFSCSASATEVTCIRSAALVVNATANIQLTFAAQAGAGSQVQNTACVAHTSDTNTANNCSTVTTPTTGTSDLVATKSLTTSPLVVGKEANYSLTVRNIGTVAASAPITVTDTLPAGLTFLQATGTGWSCGVTNSVVQCTRNAPLAPNEESSVVLRTMVTTAARPAVVNCMVVVGTSESGPSSNNRSCVEAPVDGTAQLEVTKRASKSEAQVGDIIGYTIVVRNAGTGTAAATTLSDVLPRGFVFEPNSARLNGNPVAPTAASDGTLQFVVGALAPGAQVTLTYRVRVTVAAPAGDAVNLAIIAAAGVAPASAEARVRVAGGVLDERGAIAGKVYMRCACAGNGVQQEGDVGIPGVRVFLEDGTAAITDVEGKYSFYDVRAMLHTVRVDRSTLPLGARLIATGNRNARDGYSRFVDLKTGELARADFVDASRSNEVLRAVLQRRRAGEVNNAGEPAIPSALDPSNAEVGYPPQVADTLARGYRPIAVNAVSSENSSLPTSTLRTSDKLRLRLGGGEDVGRYYASADGFGRVPVRISVRDSLGNPARGRVAVTLESDIGRWDLADADPAEPGVQTTVENGEAFFALIAPTRAGTGRVRVTHAGFASEAQVAFAPAPHPLAIGGLFSGRLELNDIVRGRLSVGQAFEDALRDWSDEADGGKQRASARSALFVRGEVLDQRQLTLRLDSERDPQAVQFRDIRPDAYFPIYGDAGLREFDAQSTRRFYARLDKGAQHTVLGDFQTTRASDQRVLSAYDRSLNGALQHMEGRLGTLSVFASQGRLRQFVDELPGRGISGPYAISRTNAVVNSEQIELIVRDRNQPSVILKRTPLTRFTDYTIEPGSGRLLFRMPIPSADEHLNPMALRVSYEVEGASAEAAWVYGGDATLRLSSALEIGGMFARDEQTANRGTLFGANVTAKLAPSTVFLGEFASAELGLTARRGDAMRAELRHDSHRLSARFQAAESDEDFNNPSSTFLAGRRELSGRITARLDDQTELNVEALRTALALSSANGRRDGASIALVHRWTDAFEGEIGYRFAKESGTFGPRFLWNPLDRDVSAARARIQWALPEQYRSKLFVEGEQDVRDHDARRLALGGEYRVASRARLYGRQEWLTGLEGAYALNQDINQQVTVFGVDADYMREGQVFSEYRARDAFAGRDAEASIGLRNRWTLAPGMLVSTSFERVSQLDRGIANVGATQAAGEALAITGALEWTRPSLWKSTARIERREAQSGDNILASFGYARKLTRDVALLARTLWDDFEATDRRTRGYSQLGLAWRQTDRNRWNGLARYEHRFDRQEVLGVASRDNAQVVSAVVNYQPQSRLVLSSRYAAKWAANSAANERTRSTSQLVMGRGTYDLTSRFDVGLIGSALTSDGFATRAYGLGAEVGVIAVNNLRLAGGYNVFGFADKDLNTFGTTKRGAYVEFGFKFDETLFGLGGESRGGKKHE